ALMTILKLRQCFQFFFQAEDGIRDRNVTGVQTCALPISSKGNFGEKIHSAIYEKAILHEEPNDMYESNDGEIVLGNYVWVNDDRWLIIGEKNKENIYARFKGI